IRELRIEIEYLRIGTRQTRDDRATIREHVARDDVRARKLIVKRRGDRRVRAHEQTTQPPAAQTVHDRDYRQRCGRLLRHLHLRLFVGRRGCRSHWLTHRHARPLRLCAAHQDEQTDRQRKRARPATCAAQHTNCSRTTFCHYFETYHTP